eukprot:1821101-Amphidinium_carterae.1
MVTHRSRVPWWVHVSSVAVLATATGSGSGWPCSPRTCQPPPGRLAFALPGEPPWFSPGPSLCCLAPVVLTGWLWASPR